MEIERKFTIRQLPDNLDAYPHYEIKQAYLCTDPVMRIRKQDSKYIFTYKGRGLYGTGRIQPATTDTGSL